jgi:hypothetical protein
MIDRVNDHGLDHICTATLLPPGVLGALGVFATEIGLLVRALVVVLAPINI